MATFKSRHSFLIRDAEAFLRLEIGLVLASEEDDDGTVVREDFPAYRAYVGKPEEWDLVASRQVTLLLAAGLRDTGRCRVRLPPGREDAHPLPAPRALLRGRAQQMAGGERDRTRARARSGQDQTPHFPFRRRLHPERVRCELRFRSGPQRFFARLPRPSPHGVQGDRGGPRSGRQTVRDL